MSKLDSVTRSEGHPRHAELVPELNSGSKDFGISFELQTSFEL
jgi:hypothetical protein